jgi:hypothetical protein
MLLLSRTTVNLLEELCKFASDVSGVAIQNWGITGTNLTGVVKNDDLGVEGFTTLGWVVLRVSADIASSDFLD